MKRYNFSAQFGILIALVLAVLLYAGGTKVNDSLTWLDDGSTDTISDTLLTTGADTTSAFTLRLEVGTGRGYDVFTQIDLLVKMQETADSDSGRLAVYFDVSENGTTWYPYNSNTALVDTIKSDGTAAQTTYWSKSFTTFAKAQYGRFRFLSVMPDDSAWVSDLDLVKSY